MKPRAGIALIAFTSLLAGCLGHGERNRTAIPGTGSGLKTQLGAICRGPTDSPRLALVFTGHEFAEGMESILDALKARQARASFFLTGDFLQNPAFQPLVRRALKERHSLGPHSDKHLLYCTWDAERRTLVSRDEFRSDLAANLGKLRRLGGERPRCFLPPYEHYNSEIAGWTREMNLRLVNFTPGTRSNADYTGEQEKNFVSSEAIYRSILAHEASDPHGLNGFLLLLHVGAGPGRTDKFHRLVPQLLDELRHRGYHFVTVEDLLR